MSGPIFEKFKKIKQSGNKEEQQKFLNEWVETIFDKSDRLLWKVALSCLATAESLYVNRKVKETVYSVEDLAIFDELYEYAVQRFKLKVYFKAKDIRVGDVIICKTGRPYKVMEVLGPKELTVAEITEYGLSDYPYPLTLKSASKFEVGAHLPENYVFSLPDLIFFFNL